MQYTGQEGCTARGPARCYRAEWLIAGFEFDSLRCCESRYRAQLLCNRNRVSHGPLASAINRSRVVALGMVTRSAVYAAWQSS